MVFAVNIGHTFAISAYSFLAKGSATADKVEMYTEFATTSAPYSGEIYTQIPYTLGTVNRRLDLNYGVSAEHDLMITFEISYGRSNPIDNLELDFANRDMWCIDLPTITPIDIASDMHYSTTSNTNTLVGVMYYLGTIDGAGTLPIISGVTFYSSPSNTPSSAYEGDNVTIKFTPSYQKSANAKYDDADNDYATNLANHYSTTHSFYSATSTYYASKTINSAYKVDNTYIAFTNWATYMKQYSVGSNYVNENRMMVYNAYGIDQTAIEFPFDFDDFDLTDENVDTKVITAYKYTITKTESNNVRDFSMLTGGNKYNGGVGIFVFPSQATTFKIKVNLYWEKDGVKQGSSTTNAIQSKVSSSDMLELTDGYYYNQMITKPTYINILEYIRLTAQGNYQEHARQGLKLVVGSVELTFVASGATPNDWSQKGDNGYTINNSTLSSPLLARYADTVSGLTKDLSVGVTNTSDSPIQINEFTVKGNLWYADNTDPLDCKETVVQTLSSLSALKYDSALWSVECDPNTHVYTFTRITNSVFNAHLGSNYCLNLISGVTVPAQSISGLVNVGDTVAVYDLWLTLDVNITNYSVINENTYAYSGSGPYSGAEVAINGYYNMITSGSESYILLKNNTSQTISSVTISGLTLAKVNNNYTNGIVREHVDTVQSFTYLLNGATKQSTNSTTITLTHNILPNDCVQIAVIKPSVNAVIYSYSVSVVVTSGNGDTANRMIANHGENYVVNRSNNMYEFRFKAKQRTDSTSALDNLSTNDYVLETKNGYVYAYYLGAIYPGQLLRESAITNNVFASVTDEISVDFISHSANVDATTQYVASKYSTWTPPTDWLNGMKAIYSAPTTSEIRNLK